MLVTFVGCSGVGKNTIINDLIRAHGDEYDLLPTLTTREMRPGESEGNPYYYVSEAEFLSQVADGRIYEHQQVHGHYYGGSHEILNRKMRAGKTLLKDIDILGANTLKRTLSGAMPVLAVFLYVDSPDELLNRLRARGESEEEIALRKKRFDMEMSLSTTSDYMILNANREATGQMIHALIQAEKAGAPYRAAQTCRPESEAAVAAICEEARAGASLARVELGYNGSEFLVTEGLDRYLAARRAGAFVQKRIARLPDKTLEAAPARA